MIKYPPDGHVSCLMVTYRGHKEVVSESAETARDCPEAQAYHDRGGGLRWHASQMGHCPLPPLPPHPSQLGGQLLP